jgi:hypothetical protein
MNSDNQLFGIVRSLSYGEESNLPLAWCSAMAIQHPELREEALQRVQPLMPPAEALLLTSLFAEGGAAARVLHDVNALFGVPYVYSMYRCKKMGSLIQNLGYEPVFRTTILRAATLEFSGLRAAPLADPSHRRVMMTELRGVVSEAGGRMPFPLTEQAPRRRLYGHWETPDLVTSVVDPEEYRWEWTHQDPSRDAEESAARLLSTWNTLEQYQSLTWLAVDRSIMPDRDHRGIATMVGNLEIGDTIRVSPTYDPNIFVLRTLQES